MRERLRAEAAVLALAWQFLTRVPLPAAPAFTPARMAAAPRWFPGVGAAVGLAGAGVLLVAGLVMPPTLAAILSVAATVVLTGALHEDGLADSCDGLGGADAGRSLEIMRDSRVGSFGALGLGLTVAAKVVALAAMPAVVAAAALVAAHAASRFSSLVLVATGRYLRAAGTAGFTARGIGRRSLLVGAGFALLALGPLAVGWPGAAVAGCVGLAAGHGLARLLFVRRLGGYTGDTLGAVQQLSEAGLYLGVLVWL